MKTIGLVGSSGSGKTTLIAKLLPEFARRGLSVSTMKHTHHHFDVDKPGKDSYLHRKSGAKEVMLVSSQRWALLHELRDDPEPPVADMIAAMTPVDLLLIEGFKSHPHPKIEIHRPALGKPRIKLGDPGIVAVASDGDLADTGIARLDLNDVAAIADFILAIGVAANEEENGDDHSQG